MEARKTKTMMKMITLKKDRTHIEDPEDKEDDENENLEEGQDAHGRPGRQRR